MVMCAQPDIDLRAVAEVVATDPALSAELLRIANSPVYGRYGKIDDLTQATLTVGLSELQSMAAAMGMLAAFAAREELGLHFQEVALLTGTLAHRLAARHATVKESTAFVGGLLKEIGALALLAIEPAAYGQLWQEAVGGWEGWGKARAADRSHAERQLFATTSAAVGAALLQRNHLPASLVDAVTCDFSVEVPTGDLTRLIHLASFTVPAVLRFSHHLDLEALSQELADLAALRPPTLSAADLQQLGIDAVLQGKARLDGD